MIIYTENINARLQYVADFIFDIFGIQYTLTNNLISFIESSEEKINYSNQQVDHAFHILPSGLLNEIGISEKKPKLTFDYVIPVLYLQKEGDLRYDIFSAVFWCLSRYEEYQNYSADNHNRFPATESLLYKHNLHEIPVVDHWISYFKDKLSDYYKGLVFKNIQFKHITTIDVDSPWCYKNKGFYRNMGGLVRDALKLKYADVFFRLAVLFNINNDPWEKFEWLNEQQEQFGFDLKYFIHVGNYGKYDKTVDHKNKKFGKIISSLSAKGEIALHPSYTAHNNEELFDNEIQRLAHLVGAKIKHSRQHYLVFNLPGYYNMLLSLGIENDYSMGFADKPGFRAGTSHAFYFFDLEKNVQTKLKVHPFVVMDRTLNTYEKSNPEKALQNIEGLIDEVKKTNGTFISLWHNESLSNRFEWKGWQEVFVRMQKYLAK